ncbi:MAG: hypothetical protein WAU39_21380 [Polyangiales bacterium]
MLTPAQVHKGPAEEILAEQQRVLDAAHTATATPRSSQLTWRFHGAQIDAMKLLITLGLAILLAACGDGGGSNAAGTGGNGTNSGTGGTGGTISVSNCGNAGRCIGDPGAPWMGPFAVIDSSIGCGDEFPDVSLQLFQGFQSGTASCECICGAATAICSTSIRATGYAQLGCINAQGQHTLAENECHDTHSASHSLRLGTTSTSCGAGTVTANLPTPSFLTSIDVCGGFRAVDGECDVGQTCVPKPGSNYDAGICYVREGDHECPADFPNKALSFTGFSDTRACPGSCTCTGSGASCNVSVNRFTGTNCGSPQDVVTVGSGADSCIVPNSTVVKSIRPGDVEIVSNGTCSPGGISVSGTVASEGATTVCCG